MLTLAFVANRHNLNSIAALTGALETDPLTRAVSLHFLWQDADLIARLEELARTAEKLVIALSFATADLPPMSHLLENIRGLLPQAFIVAGGPHPSARPAQVLDLGADAVVIGEGEATLPVLLERIAEDGVPPGLPGVAIQAPDGRLARGPRPDPVDLDAWPPLGVQHRRFGPIEITRGCPCACAFCQTSFLFGGRMRHRSVEAIVYWVGRAMERGYNYLRFVTPNAFAFQSEDNGRTVNLDAVECLVREMASLVGREQVYFGSFPSEVGPETVTPGAVALVRRHCGNDNLILGAQSGSDRMLRALNRGHAVADVYRAAEVIVAGRLKPIVDVIFGLPGETQEDLSATMRMMKDLVAMGAVLHTHTFMPLPGSPLENAPPGRVDPALYPLLDRLASQGHQIGQWRKQQEIGLRGNLSGCSLTDTAER
ncbi:TIGR04013 family B12-binding domain/radical SAM domain-containing protein [Chloroflexota bacterium]